MQNLKFYDFARLESYGSPFMVACGMRNMGKTYDCSRRAVRRFIKTGAQFVYLRRTKDELVTKDQFFDAFAHEFPDHDFRVIGKEAHIAHASTREDKRRKWEVCGYFAPLTQAQTFKGGNFPKVETIIFDEFIAESANAYKIKNEVQVLLNFYYTFARHRAGRVRLYMLSNSIEMSNPYFVKWGIDPTEVVATKGGIKKYFDVKDPKTGETSQFVAVHIIDNEGMVSAIDATEWGQFLRNSDPDYAAYAVDNQFADAHDLLVEPKPPTAIHMFNLETPTGKFSLWQDRNRKMYAQKKIPKSGPWLTMIPNNVDGDMPLLATSDKLAGRLRTAWRNGTMYFDQKQTRNIFMEVFK